MRYGRQKRSMNRRWCLGAGLIATFSLLCASTLLAQEPASPDVVSLFSWATSTPPDWGTGALLALMGLIGALVVVFGHVGGAVPGTAGYVRIEANLSRVEDREKELDRLIKAKSKNPEEIRAVEEATNNLRDDVRDDKRRQFTIAAFLYAVLGAFFATLLARDLLQAVVLGAGWTSYFGMLGLKSDGAARKSIKDATAERLAILVSLAEERGCLDTADDDLDEARLEAQVARAL